MCLYERDARAERKTKSYCDLSGFVGSIVSSGGRGPVVPSTDFGVDEGFPTVFIFLVTSLSFAVSLELDII